MCIVENFQFIMGGYFLIQKTNKNVMRKENTDVLIYEYKCKTP